MDHFRRNWDGGVLQGLLSDLSYVAAFERLGRRLINDVLWRAPVDGTQIALTFDDGPHPSYTPQVTKILACHGVHATFFTIGRHAAIEPSIVKEAVSAGHEIANHTYTHPLLIGRPEAFVSGELHRTDQLLREMGCDPRFFRPPMGLFSKSVLRVARKQGYLTVVGDVYPRDPHRPGARRIVNRIVARVRRGSIIILHDGGNSESVDRTQTVEALNLFVPALIDRGFRFVTMSQLINSNLSLNGEKP